MAEVPPHAEQMQSEMGGRYVANATGFGQCFQARDHDLLLARCMAVR
jgi:hypothetical protein